MSYRCRERAADPDGFDRAAAEYCRERRLDYRYLPQFCAYQRAYSGAVVHDASFLVEDRGEAVALAFAPIERRPDGLSIAIAGGFVPAPAADGEAAEAAAYARLDAVAREAGAARVALHACPSSQPWQWNRLRKYGFIDASALDAQVDLTLDEPALWRSLRKSYKALINKYSDGNGCETVIVDADRPDRGLHELYLALHAKCAGRVTRAAATFDAQYDMLRAGTATLLLLKCRGAVAGCAYFAHHGAGVEYFSMADDPDLAPLRLPVSHVLLWAAVRHFKARGFLLLRLSSPAGFSAVEGFGDYSDAKALGIAHFKHGIATRIAPAWRGIRYYDAAAFDRDVAQFRERGLTTCS